MNITRLAHVCFNVSDMEKALAFYREGLGFTVVYELTYGDVLARVKADAGNLPADVDEGAIRFLTANQHNPWSVYLKVAPGQFMELFYAPPGAESISDLAHRVGFQHFCLEVDDIDAAHIELIARGIAPEAPPRVGPDHAKQFWIVDPDGNRVEIMQYTPASLHVVNGAVELA